MDQHPVAQRSSTTAVNLFAQRICHHRRDAHKPQDSRQPAKTQPGPSHHGVKAVATQRPPGKDSEQYGQCAATGVPHSRQVVATVNVSPDRMSLIAKYDSQRLINFVKVLMRVTAYQRAGGTVLFAGVSLAPRPVRIQPGALAEIAFD